MAHPIRTLLCGAAMAAGIAAGASAQVRVVTWNCAALDGDTGAIQAVLAAMHGDDARGFAHPVDVFAFQEVQGTADASSLLAMVQAGAPAGSTYALGTFTTSSSEDQAAGAQALIYRMETISEVASSHADISTGAGRKSDRWLLTLDGYSSTAARFYLYSSHLKASTGSDNENQRLTGAVALRNDADALGVDVRAIFVGDYNVYTSAEPAFEEMLAAGNAQAYDPWGPGDWTGEANAWKHTQSPLLVTGNLVGGGMDDRFDMHLPTAQLVDGSGISLIASSYRPVGNDGQHYNGAINTGNNSYFPGQQARSNALADLLFVASDHIPVMADYQVPARVGASLAAHPTRVIQGASVPVTVSVQNTAVGATAECVDDLPFTATGSGVYQGSASGVAAWAPGSTPVQLALNTSAVGNLSGSVAVTTSAEAAEGLAAPLTGNATVVRHANASLSASDDVDSRTIPWQVTAGTGVATMQVAVSNFGLNSLQALLDIDGAVTLSGAASVTGALPDGIGATSAIITVSMQTNGLAPGTVTSTIRIDTSDEDLPGASNASLTLQLAITVVGGGVLGDLNGDALVNGQDLAILLSQWGGGGSGDIDGSGLVDGADLTMLVGAWG